MMPCRLIAAALVSALPSGAFAVSFDVFGTGLDSSGNPLSGGARDADYQVSGVGDAFVLRTPLAGPWLGYDPADESDLGPSRWIGESDRAGDEDGPASTSFTVTTSFDLTGFDETTAALTLDIAVDNSVSDVILNGASTGISLNGFQSFQRFTIDSGFVTGENVLVFTFRNATGPSGLRVAAAGEADLDAAAIPLPASVLLIVGGLGGLAVVGRRRA